MGSITFLGITLTLYRITAIRESQHAPSPEKRNSQQPTINCQLKTRRAFSVGSFQLIVDCFYVSLPYLLFCWNDQNLPHDDIIGVSNAVGSGNNRP